MTKEEKKKYMKEYNRKYYLAKKNILVKRHIAYIKTPIGRANNLISSYKYSDKRDKYLETVDFDAKWLLENIMNKPCKYCGKTGWDVIGCNRINNEKGHSKDNIEPCCKDCNSKLGLDYQWNKTK